MDAAGPTIAGDAADTSALIIIGAGLAGWTVAREFRKRNPTAPVTLVCADAGDFYAKPSLSNALVQKRAPEQLVSTPAAKMAQSLNLTLVPHTVVEAIDPAAQTIATRQGQLHYDQLVLATGAQAIRVPLGGDAADQVLSVNSLIDFARFHAGLAGADAGGRHVAIMGAGLIGCEFANDLVAAGHRVSVIDPSTGPLAALLPAEASVQMQQALAALGVAWHWGTTVQSVRAAVTAEGAGPWSALTLELSNGKTLSADMVLSAVGLKSDLALAQAAGLACERGIVVDRLLQTSAPQVYALGDSAQYASAGSRTLPFVMPIMGAAKALAATLAGRRTEVVFPPMPVGVKTPAFPIVVAPAAPGAAGAWRKAEEGVWHFVGAAGAVHGFVLTGKQTARRVEMASLLEPV
jgi:rubredoxin-NAD+ reductase